MDKITVGWMYPNLLNLHGERGSIQALVQVGKKMDIDVEILRIEDFDDPIPFDKLDLMVFLPGEIATFPHLIPALQSNELRAYLEKGGHLLALGTTGLMFGKSITREDGSQIKGLGYLDMTAKERKFVWGDDLYFRENELNMELVGSQIQMADVDAKNPFGTTIYGRGNNNTGAEGARWNNLIYTNCLGPFLVKNPWFAAHIFNEILQKRGIFFQNKVEFPVQENAFNSTVQFIKNKIKN